MLNERESKNFLELAALAMKSNAIIDRDEKAVYETYKREVNLLDYQLKNIDREKLVTAFLSSTKKVRKAVYIELAGVLYADDRIDQKEQDWLEQLGKEWGFRDTEIRRMIRWVQDFNDLLNEGYDYILK